jgi:putative NADPH-quinone reductase
VDPVIAGHCEQLASAEGIVIIHPNWWGMPPAVLKGWIDRVVRPEVAYRFEDGDCGEGIPAGLLKAKTAVVFNTSNTPEKREREVFGDPLEGLWKTCIFDLCGVRGFYRRNYSVVVTSTEEERKNWLEEVADIVRKAFP